MQTGYIYMMVDFDGVPFYIGKTINIYNRKRGHKAACKKYNHYLYNKLNKLINEGYQIELVIIEEVDLLFIDFRERYWIKYHRDLGYKLCNLTDGGEFGGNKEAGRKAAETRMKKGYTHSEVTRLKMSQAAKDKPKSKEHKEALKKAWKRTPEQLQKKSAAASKTSKGKINIKKYVCISPEGEEFITENGLTLFCEQNNLTPSNLHKVLKGERNNHKGWRIKNYDYESA